MNELDLYRIFKNIIAQSKTMRRFIVAPQYGVELNKNNVGEILNDILGGINDWIKYPLCLMFPPVEMIEDYDRGWSKFKCRMFFLDAEYKSNINQNNNLSQKTIQQNWNEMRGCAVDFRRYFKELTQANVGKEIRDGQTYDVIDRYSDIGNDRVAGVGISFEVDLFLGCEITDYDTTNIELIEL